MATTRMIGSVELKNIIDIANELHDSIMSRINDFISDFGYIVSEEYKELVEKVKKMFDKLKINFVENIHDPLVQTKIDVFAKKIDNMLKESILSYTRNNVQKVVTGSVAVKSREIRVDREVFNLNSLFTDVKMFGNYVYTVLSSNTETLKVIKSNFYKSVFGDDVINTYVLNTTWFTLTIDIDDTDIGFEFKPSEYINNFFTGFQNKVNNNVASVKIRVRKCC